MGIVLLTVKYTPSGKQTKRFSLNIKFLATLGKHDTTLLISVSDQPANAVFGTNPNSENAANANNPLMNFLIFISFSFC